jgi:DNA primase
VGFLRFASSRDTLLSNDARLIRQLGEIMINADLLRRIRNDLPMPVTIAALGCDGPPSKMREGYFRFLCPHCGDMQATVNPRNNLAHCFSCKKNLNNIDLLMMLGYDFKTAVAVLEQLLERYESRLPKKKTPAT